MVNCRRLSEIKKIVPIILSQERDTAVLSELFKIAVRNSISLLGLANTDKEQR